MNQRHLNQTQLQTFRCHLLREEKSTATVEKYLRDVRAFFSYAGQSPVTKNAAIAWKNHLLAQGYAPRSVNSMLAALNSFLLYMGWGDCRVKALKLQRALYCAEEKQLTKAEYERLLKAASGQPALRLVMQTICATGIRVSELRHFTVEAAKRGEVVVSCKGKTRTILIPGKLRRLLLDHARRENIRSGAIFLARSGAPLDRKTVWARMKSLCAAARVQPGKVFPHNLRKLFARAFYRLEKDIAKLADLLGHSSIETTRIYIMTTGAEHRRKIERLGLVV